MVDTKTIIAKNQYRIQQIPIKYTHYQLALNHARQALFGSGWSEAQKMVDWKLDKECREKAFLDQDSYTGDFYHNITTGSCGDISKRKLKVTIKDQGTKIFDKRELIKTIRTQETQSSFNI